MAAIFVEPPYDPADDFPPIIHVTVEPDPNTTDDAQLSWETEHGFCFRMRMEEAVDTAFAINKLARATRRRAGARHGAAAPRKTSIAAIFVKLPRDPEPRPMVYITIEPQPAGKDLTALIFKAKFGFGFRLGIASALALAAAIKRVARASRRRTRAGQTPRQHRDVKKGAAL